MPDETAPQTQPENQEVSSSRVILGVVIAIIILGGLTYAAYLYSNRQGGSVFPAGYPQQQAAVKPPTFANIDCANPDPSYKTHPNYYIKCDPYTESANTTWDVIKNPVRGIKFEFPSELKLSAYANGYGFAWRTLQPTTNLAASVELAANRSGNYKTMTGQDYPTNYWKQYPGLTGLKSIASYTTKSGITGWQAVYLYGTETPTIDTFFEDPTVPGDYIHFSKGVLSDAVYTKVLDSFAWTPKSSPSPAPSGSAAPVVASPAASPAQ